MDTKLQRKLRQKPSSLAQAEKHKGARVKEFDRIYTRDHFVEEMIRRKVEYALRVMKRYDA